MKSKRFDHYNVKVIIRKFKKFDYADKVARKFFLKLAAIPCN